MGVPANGIRPYKPTPFRPPTPDPLPPAPWITPTPEGLAWFLLSQLWGAWNAPEQTTRIPQQVAYSRAGIYRVGISRTTTIAGKICAGGASHFDEWTTTDWISFGQSSNRVTSLSISASGWNAPLECVGRPLAIRYAIQGSVTTEQSPSGSSYSLEPSPSSSFSAFEGGVSADVSITTVECDGAALPVPAAFVPIDKPRRPAPKPATSPKRKIPVPVVPRPQTVPAPAPGEPDPAPSPTPQEPGTEPPAQPPIPRPPSVAPPRVANPRDTDSGRLTNRPPQPVPVTPGNVVYPIPGGSPIGAPGPRPTPEGTAEELGRIEQKLHVLMNPQQNPPDWINLLARIAEVLLAVTASQQYVLTEECNPDNDPNYVPQSWTFNANGALTPTGAILNRIDALAAMVDQTVRARQVVCPPRRVLAQGNLVTVNFRSVAISANGNDRLRKVFRYRDQLSRPLIEHVEHWEEFQWEAGPVIVVSKGLDWGSPKVWAATAAEGKRVIGHAAVIAGVDLTDDRHQWVVTGSADPRYGQSGTMAVDDRGGEFLRVTSRPGPDGPPMGYSPVS